MPVTVQQRTYQQMAQVVDYFIQHQSSQPSLAELAQHVGLSEFHLQKVFSRWVGVSPKQFLKFLTKQQAKQRLREFSVLESALDCGLSGGSRLYDLMITCEGVTPGQYKQWGEGVVIEYGEGHSPFGMCLVAFTEKGLCKLAFFDDEVMRQSLLAELKQDWPAAELKQNQSKAEGLLGQIFAVSLNGEVDDQKAKVQQPLHLLMKGSPFQLQVWEALLSIPQGALCTYQNVADKIGKPSAARAVASAIAKNNIGYLIPCHRVIRASGEFSQYRWGAERKPMLIGWESCHKCFSDAADFRAEVD